MMENISSLFATMLQSLAKLCGWYIVKIYDFPQRSHDRANLMVLAADGYLLRWSRCFAHFTLTKFYRKTRRCNRFQTQKCVRVGRFEVKFKQSRCYICCFLNLCSVSKMLFLNVFNLILTACKDIYFFRRMFSK